MRIPNDLEAQFLTRCKCWEEVLKFISDIENNLEFTRTSLVEAQIVSRESDIWREFNNNFWSIMNQITTEMKLGKFGTSSELLSQMSDPDKHPWILDMDELIASYLQNESSKVATTIGQITGYMSDKELKYGAITTYERTCTTEDESEDSGSDYSIKEKNK
ncbi:10056_t:CDS:2 [Entrophospora sp. SA101]|nr:10056_t:CDS:2 [Entrophospora sp. SA101]CAJ0845221.1 7564_t:CDS:2 [Entrophospora sp. SA101]